MRAFLTFLLLSLAGVALANPAGDYDFQITPEPGNKYLARLEQKQGLPKNESIGEVILRWTAPNGQMTSVPVRRVSASVWASQLALDLAPGKNKLDLMVIGRTSDGAMGPSFELLYEYDLKEHKLAFMGTRAPKTGSAPPPAAAPPSRLDFKSLSIPVIVLMVGICNVLLLLPGLLIFRILRKFSASDRRRGPVLLKNGGDLHPLYAKILAGGGLIDRRTGGPLEWGAAITGTEPDKTNHDAVPKEALEATVHDSPLNGGQKMANLKRYTPADFKKLSTPELVELVADAVEWLERGKDDPELKNLIKIAEKELALREQKTESKSQTRTDNLSTTSSKALYKKTIDGSAEIADKKMKLDLTDLSF